MRRRSPFSRPSSPARLNAERKPQNHGRLERRQRRGRSEMALGAWLRRAPGWGSRSMRTVSMSVAMRRTVRRFTSDRARALASMRSRRRGSSPGSGRAIPVRHRPPTSTRTRGSTSTLRTYDAPRPCSATIQTTSPTSPSVTGVRRGKPDLRPTVSNNRVPGTDTPRANSQRSNGLATYLARPLAITRLVTIPHQPTTDQHADTTGLLDGKRRSQRSCHRCPGRLVPMTRAIKGDPR